jgi:hypothetical protein
MRGLLLASGYVLLLGVFLVMILRARRLRRLQHRLLPLASGAAGWNRIHVARPGHFNTLFKWLPFEARGLLIDEGAAIRVVADTSSGERIDVRYPRTEANVRWLGNARLASGNLHWIAVGHGASELMICADTGLINVRSRAETADLYRRIAPQLTLPEGAESEFALEKNPRSLTLIVLFFSLLAFALLDGLIFNKNVLLAGKQVTMLAAPFSALALLSYPALTRGGVPSRESLALAMLLMLGMGLAFVPLIKRVDQLFAPGGPQAIQYRLEARGRLVATSANAPVLDYSRYDDYWAQFDEGSLHEFELTQGAFGLWQLNEAEFRTKLRRFYEGRDRAPN